VHRRVVFGLVALTLVVAAGSGLFAWRWLSKSAYEQAVAALPALTLRATYTDWAQVRTLQDGTSLGAGSASREVDAFLDRAYRADLTSASAVSGATYAMTRRYGFSPLNATWEMYGQSREGAVTAMKLPESVDLAAVERNLRTLGYDEPEAGDGSAPVWAGSAELVAQIDGSLTPVFQNVVVLEDQRVVLLSDSKAYVSSSAQVVRGSAESMADATDGVSDLADVAGEPVSAVMWASDFGCEALSMSAADEEDQTVGDQLVSEAGGVSPLSGVVLAHQRDRSLVVGMNFESADQAERNLRPRTDLASGEAVGQGGMFSDRFEIASARSTGRTVVLALEPTGDTSESSLLSDLSPGPVLFATC